MSQNKSKMQCIVYTLSYLDKNFKKATINLVNRDDKKCLQYATTLALSQKEI